MNLTEKAKLRTYLKLKDFFALYSAILASLPNFAAVLGEFNSLLASILSLVSAQTLDKKGIGDTKKDWKKRLCVLTDDVKNKLYSYALFSNDLSLKAETNKTEKAISRLPDSELYGYAQSMYNRAQSKLASLAPYGITAASQTALQTGINNFLAFMPKPTEGVQDSNQMSVKLSDLIKSQDQAQIKFKSLMAIIKYSQPAVYSAYLDAVKVVPIGGRKTAVKCRAVNEALEGVKGAKFTFVRVADAENKLVGDAEPFVRMSSTKGGLYLRSLQAGTYRVKVVYTGYYEEEAELVYNGNDLVKLEVQLKLIAKNV